MPGLFTILRRLPSLPLALVDASKRAKFNRNGRRASELSMASDEQRQRIVFVDQKTDPAIRIGEASSSAQRHYPSQAEAVPELSFDLGVLGNVTATMTGAVCRTLVEHCGESNLHGREVGGVLVGYRSERELTKNSSNERSYELVVTNSIPVRSFDSSSDHLSFTEESWKRAEQEIHEKYAGDRKLWLGWYHTHPEQGIFLSDSDETAHSIFAEPYQFALVVDPRSMQAGLFHWRWNADKIVAGPIFFSLSSI
jgi:proteasome lid subunit RPN8/RPN11